MGDDLTDRDVRMLLQRNGEKAFLGAFRPGEFVPGSVLYAADLDQGMLLAEDISYYAESLFGDLHLLWHPYERRLIGCSLERFSHYTRSAVEFTHLSDSVAFSEIVYVAITERQDAEPRDAKSITRYLEVVNALSELFCAHPTRFVLSRLRTH